MAQMYTFFLYEQKIGCFRGRIFIYRLTSTSKISVAKSRGRVKKFFIAQRRGLRKRGDSRPAWGSETGGRIYRQLRPAGSASG